MLKDLSEEATLVRTMESQEKFLLTIEDGTAAAKSKENLKNWEEDKIPGFSRNDILPSDLVLIIAAQKKAVFHFLPDYTPDSAESIAIVQEMEDYYTQVQDNALNMLFKIQKTTEEQLKKMEERFRLLVQNVKDYAIFFLDTAGNIQSWNEGAQRMIGFSKEEIIGKHLSVFYTPKDIEEGIPENNLKMALEKGHYETEGWRVRKDGSNFWAEALYTALYDDRGRLKGFSKIERDTTDIRNARLELEKKTKETGTFKLGAGAVCLCGIA